MKYFPFFPFIFHIHRMIWVNLKIGGVQRAYLGIFGNVSATDDDD